MLVTLFVLPALLVLDLYLWGELWFAHCAGQDATCGDPPTEAARRRGIWLPSLTAAATVLAVGALWKGARRAARPAGARALRLYGVIAGAQFALFLATLVW